MLPRANAFTVQVVNYSTPRAKFLFESLGILFLSFLSFFFELRQSLSDLIGSPSSSVFVVVASWGSLIIFLALGGR